MDELKDYIYSQISYTVVRDYQKKVHGNGITEETVTGRNLEKENVLELESIDEKLDIENPVEVRDVDIEILKTALQSYEQNLQKSKRVLKDSGQDGIAYEVEQIKRRVQDMLREIEDEDTAEDNTTGVQEL